MIFKPASKLNSDKAVAVILALCVFSVYLFTLLPGIHGWGDITKWQFLGSILGTPHPTGYPLYLLITHIVSKIPFFSLAWKINAFSALCMTTAVIGLFTMLRQAELPRVFSALSAMCFAFASTVWSQSVVAEVYAFNAALISWTSVMFISWHKKREMKYFFAACLLYSLSFGNHLTVICLLPTILLLTIMTDATVFVRPRIFLPVILFILLGMSLYLYLFWRSQVGGVHLEYRIFDLDSLMDYISGERYRRHMFSLTPMVFMTEKIPEFMRTIWDQFQILSLLSIIGLFTFRSRTFGLFILFAILGYAAFIMNYTIRDIEVYYIPVYLFLMVLIAKGFWLPFSQMESRWIYIIKHALILLAALALFLTNFKTNDLSRDHRFDQRVQGTLNRLGSNAVVMLEGWGRDYGIFEGLMYYLYVENALERNIYIIDKVSAKKAKAYLKGKAELFSPVMDLTIPTGLSLFVVNKALAQKISSKQISTKKKGTNLYQMKYTAPSKQDNHSIGLLDIRLEDIVLYEGALPIEQEIRDIWESNTTWHGDRHIAQENNLPGRMAIRLYVQEPGDYIAEINLTHAPVNGIVSVLLDNQKVNNTIDLYSRQIRSQIHAIHLKDLQEGDHFLEFRVRRKNENSKGYGIGLDFIRFKEK